MSTPDHVVSPAGAGRRERKKLETRERIFESGVALFATHGYDSATMEQIGERADVSRATVFNYFARKEDIVFEWFGRLRAEFAKALASDDQHTVDQHTVDSTSRLRFAFRVLADLYEDDPATGRAMVRAWQRAGGPLLADESDAPQLVADSVRAGQLAGDVPGGVDPDRVALILFDAYLGVLYRWVLDETDQLALGEQLTATLDLILPAIIRTSSVDTNGPNRRRTGKTRRTAS
ncbi:MAG TPA: TetR/AcrR family transcriptional regulator [Ilumatobacteraceae bacterium]|nr:TetR/AcrR family transcriptional regulator [Ilumatobacteraceae bacterium]